VFLKPRTFEVFKGFEKPKNLKPTSTALLVSVARRLWIDRI